MAQFADEKKRTERLDELHAREEEQLAEMLSKKYGVDYVDLTKKSIDSDALRLLFAAETRASAVAAFPQINKKHVVAVQINIKTPVPYDIFFFF